MNIWVSPCFFLFLGLNAAKRLNGLARLPGLFAQLDSYSVSNYLTIRVYQLHRLAGQLATVTGLNSCEGVKYPETSTRPPRVARA